MNLFFRVSLFILLTLLFLSCQGPKGDSGPIGPSGSQVIGDLIGTVKLFDEFSNPIYNNSGVTVSIYPDSLQTITDTTGKWMFANLKAGVHSMVFQKQGFGIFKKLNFQFIGGGAVLESIISLYQPPNYNLNWSGDLVTSQDTFAYYIGSKINNNSGKSRYVRWFAVYHDNNYDSTFRANGIPYILTNHVESIVDSFAIYVPVLLLRNLGVKSGTKIDVIPCAESSPVSYTDPITGLEIYPFIAEPHSWPTYIMP